jgi:hypothetical protein
LAKWDKKITLQKEEYTQGKWLSDKEVLEIAKEKKLAPDTKLFFEKYLKESNYQKNR